MSSPIQVCPPQGAQCMSSLLPRLLAAVSLLFIVLPAHAAEEATGPWFGLPLPPAFTPHTLPAILGDRSPPPARVPAGEEQWTEFSGARIWQDLEKAVSFSHRSRETKELGSDQLWGRVSGFPSAVDTVEWMVEPRRHAWSPQ